MHRLGPYEFTDTDAARTIANFPGIWHEMVLGRDASTVAHLLPDLDGEPVDVLPRVWEAMLAAGPALAAAGQLPARAEGVVAQLNRSDGGVPKTPVDRVEVGWRGVAGDRQRSRQHHGTPVAGAVHLVDGGHRRVRRRGPPDRTRLGRRERHRAAASTGRSCAPVSDSCSARCCAR